jgi:hypothetical protein
VTVNIPAQGVTGALPSSSSNWKDDRTDPHEAGCLNKHGHAQDVRHEPVVLSGRTVATLYLYANVDPECGLVWAEVWTGDVAPNFASAGIRTLSVTVSRVGSPPGCSATWDSSDVVNAGDSDEWTCAYQIAASAIYTASVTATATEQGA